MTPEPMNVLRPSAHATSRGAESRQDYALPRTLGSPLKISPSLCLCCAILMWAPQSGWKVEETSFARQIA